MGCDIHVAIQHRVKNEWVTLPETVEPTDYGLFALLADVKK
jgi:hypothetical protein